MSFSLFSGEMIAIAEMKADNTDITGHKAVLYSSIQKSSSDLGCVTITHSGRNVDLDVFISQGTVLSPDDIVYQRRSIQSELFMTSSFQTPIDIPFVVSIKLKTTCNHLFLYSMLMHSVIFLNI